MVTIWGWQTQSPYEDMERSSALSCPSASQPQTPALRRGSTWSHCPVGVTSAERGQSPVQGGTQHQPQPLTWGMLWQGKGLSHVPGCPGQSREPGLALTSFPQAPICPRV